MVARFVGSPQMNLFVGKLDESGATLDCGSVRLDMAALKPGLHRFAGQPLIVGVRPEDLRPVDPARAWLAGEIELIEDLGSDRLLHIRHNDVDLVARAGREETLRVGQQVSLNVDFERLHFFQDGTRVELQGMPRAP
jgi:ABC-type sugar transport system ATPase subunit